MDRTEGLQELTFINQHDFHNSIEWDVYFVGAHAVGATFCRSIVTITELFRWDVVDLRQRWWWWEHKGNLVDKTDDMVTSWGNCQHKKPVIVSRPSIETCFFQKFEVGIFKKEFIFKTKYLQAALRWSNEIDLLALHVYMSNTAVQEINMWVITSAMAKITSTRQTELTKISVIWMWLENFLWSVEQESEGQENFYIRTLLK